jgi:bifunctional NMN adenylyltransferase/nudix hydrolase
MEYEYAVFIGRFQPFHNGHLAVVERALERAEKILILIGSSDGPRTVKNPFTFEERRDMITSCLKEKYDGRFFFDPLEDEPYDDELWANNVCHRVNVRCGNDDDKILLVGYEKDHSSYYLKMFPQWKFFPVLQKHVMSATDIRYHLFKSYSNSKYINYTDDVPKQVFRFIEQFSQTIPYLYLLSEFNYIENYKKDWEYTPYPPVFVTADSVVTHRENVLLIRRGRAPGKGLLALPGGFVNQNETVYAAAIRELKEETSLDILKLAPYGSCYHQLFDHPDRSQRGRTITAAYLFEISDNKEPVIKADDDAMEVMWVPFENVRDMRSEFFEDHFFITEKFIAI